MFDFVLNFARPRASDLSTGRTKRTRCALHSQCTDNSKELEVSLIHSDFIWSKKKFVLSGEKLINYSEGQFWGFGKQFSNK